jgi:hypothetical protein
MRRYLVAAAVALALMAPSAGAGEIGAFLTLPTPTKDWKTGFGFHAAVISLPFLQAGGEFARMAGENPLVSIETYTAQVELNPPSLKISPFIGLGVGAYRQKFGGSSDWGSVNAVFGGVRVPIGAARLRAEFRKIGLSGTPRVNIDKRFSLGISFRF